MEKENKEKEANETIIGKSIDNIDAVYLNELDNHVMGESLYTYLCELGEKLGLKDIEKQKVYFEPVGNHIEIGFVKIELIH